MVTPATRKGTILVVDDDRLVLATLAHGLTQAGYDVIDADNGDDAILLAREHRPDLALLDIRMEGKSGFDVAAYLRGYCRIPFMFLSAFADAETVSQVRALGAVAYLVKPLDIGQIVPAVEAAFARIDAAGTNDGTSANGAAGPDGAAPAMVDGLDASPPAADPLAGLGTPVAIAVGILMHRFSLTRRLGFERLERLAQADGRSVAEHARRVIEAIEVLATPAG